MIVLKGIGFVLLGAGLFLLATFVVMRLWNWLVPSLFNGPRLRFVQALGLFFLIRLLVGFGSFGNHGYGYFGHHGYGRPYWHHGWHDRQNRVDDNHRQRLKPAPQESIPDEQ